MQNLLDGAPKDLEMAMDSDREELSGEPSWEVLGCDWVPEHSDHAPV